MEHPVAGEALKATPVALYAAADAATSSFSFTIPEIISYFTLIYATGLAIQTLWKGCKWLREYWGERHIRRTEKRRRKRT